MLPNFYSISLSARVTMVFAGPGKFGSHLKDRFGKLIRYPKFSPPMKFQVEKHVLPFHLLDYVPAPYVHDEMNFEFSYEKRLTSYEIESRCLVLQIFFPVLFVFIPASVLYV
jgi:hypothetical protein